MIEVLETESFSDWLRRLRDQQARRASSAVLIAWRSEISETTDRSAKAFSSSVSTYGPSYRLYFIRRGNALVILLCGGDKSTQERDIRKAQALAREWEA